MANGSVLARLLASLWGAPHEYRPSTQIFPDLSVDKIAAELDLAERARARGGRDEPSSDSSGLDEVEARIVERVEAEKKASQGILEEQLQTTADRLASLDLEGRFALIQQVAPECIGTFRASLATGRDELHALRRKFLDHEDELKAFKLRHGVQHVARVHSGIGMFFKVALLAFLLVFEVFINGSFLAKGSELGLIGGTTEAFGFAALNLGGAVLLGLIGFRQIHHRSAFRKLIGVLAFIAFLALMVLLNLTLAHYREVAGSFVTHGGVEAIRRVTSAPLSLEDVTSWIFFGIGCLFAIVAFIDSLLLLDRYPGYGDSQKKLNEARDAYIKRKQLLVNELEGIRDDYSEKIDQVRSDLSVRRSELDSILYYQSRLIQLFDEHQSQLERACQALLGIYREENVRVRKTPKPRSFSKSYRLSRVSVTLSAIGEDERKALKETIQNAQDSLTSQATQIHNEFNQAIDRYLQVDDMVSD